MEIVDFSYQEAENIIKQKGEYFNRDGKRWKRVIAPLNDLDFEKFVNLLFTKPDAKDYVKKYSSDNSFRVAEFRVELLAGETFK